MISVADLKVWLGIDAGTTTWDTTLEDLEARAVELLERRTNRYFGDFAETTEYLTGAGTADLWLPEVPKTLPATVTERVRAGDTTTTTITAADDDGYVLRSSDRAARLIRKGGYTWLDGYEYEVTFERGYTAGSEPGDVRQAVIDLVTRTFRRRGSEGLKRESVGGYSYSLADDGDDSVMVISPFVDSVIRIWRRRPVE